jgi:hypothetical protein
MARQRKGQGSEPDAPAEPAVATDPGSEPQADLRVRGGVSAVRRQLGGGEREQPTEDKPPETPEEIKRFNKAIREAKHRVVVKRIAPRFHEGQRCNVEVYREDCPLTLDAVSEEVFGQHGGRRYRVAVIDPNTDATIAARVISHDDDPILPEDTDEKLGRDILRAGGGESADASAHDEAAAIERQNEKLRARLSQEELEQELERKRQLRGGAKSSEEVRRLEMRQIKADHDREVDRIKSEHQRERDLLERRLEQLEARMAAPKSDNENTLLREMIREMREDRKATDERFNKMMEKQNEDKLSAIQAKLDAMQSRKPESVNALDTITSGIEKVVGAAKALGYSRGDDEEDEADPDSDTHPDGSPKSLTEKIGDKIISYLPQVFDAFLQKEKGGAPVDKEQLVREVTAVADQAAADAMARQRAAMATRPPMPPPRVVPAAPPPALPQGAVPSATPRSPVAVPPTTPPPVGAPVVIDNATAPVPVTPSVPEPQVVEAVPVAPEAVVVNPVEQEIRERIGDVIADIVREMQIRPREWEWSYNAFDDLPDEVRVKVAAAEDPVTMIDAFRGWTDDEALDKLKQEIAGNQTIKDWLARGLAQLKRWEQKAKEDPDFTPGDEQGEVD